MTNIGNHSAAAFADLAHSGALRLNARDLPRDLVADDPDLAQERLQGALVRAPAAVVDAIHAEYRVVREHPLEASGVTPPRGASPNLPAMANDAIAIATRG